jgi:hypothetical protein
VRRANLLLIALAVLVFLGISALLARAFNADGTERSAITSLVQAEGAGSAPGIRRQLDNCASTPACRARTAMLAASLRRPGRVVILTLDTSASFTLTSSTGTARVAWDTSASKLPIVQCLRVHRAGDVLSGFTVHLVRVSARIKSDTDCPSRF